MASDTQLQTPGSVIVLHDDDNIVVARRSISAGESVTLNGVDILTVADIPVGHKIASRPLRKGEKVVKYGAPIGSALRDIEAGEHVHMNNMTSDYIPGHLRDHSK